LSTLTVTTGAAAAHPLSRAGAAEVDASKEGEESLQQFLPLLRCSSAGVNNSDCGAFAGDATPPNAAANATPPLEVLAPRLADAAVRGWRVRLDRRGRAQHIQ
jgi:hypothetical protein